MPLISLLLNEDENYKVNLYKAKHNLGTKQEAISKIISEVKI
jgi:hypothetical protein